MWIFTRDGFYSCVLDKHDANIVWIRSRDRDDLEMLVTNYVVNTREICEDIGTDYKFRIAIWQDEFVRIVAEGADDVNYNNFKDTVASELGYFRAMMLTNI